MKKLINAPSAVVPDMLEGIVAQSDRLALLEGTNVVVRRDSADRKDRVAIISGGGSGHEPAHAGYVGPGMLTAAVSGDVFTSPSVDAVLDAIRAVGSAAGVMLIVKNYTGDRLNFGLAAELAIAAGIPVEIVVVADDVSLSSTVLRQRRRGIAGAVLVHKIAGAAAERGYDLARVADLARRAADAVGSMGVGLSACIVPAVGKPGFELGEDEAELGLGIHGEKGVERVAMDTADALANRLLDAIVADGNLKSGDRIALLLNNLGTTTEMELSIVMRTALAKLAALGLVVERVWQGTYLSALDMAGVSISLMRLDDELLGLLDDPAQSAAWRAGSAIATITVLPRTTDTARAEAGDGVGQALVLRPKIEAIAQALLARVDHFTELDSIAGDGDLGMSVERAARALLDLPDADYNSYRTLLLAIARTLRKVVGGSSGPFYAIGLARAARPLAGVETPTPEQWLAAFEAAVDAVEELGGARVGDRTMVDSLRPAVEEMRRQRAGNLPIDVSAIAAAAGMGAKQTARMHPRMGRASYLGERATGVEDGGAAVVATWLAAL
jgi:ATP-dependent dihydroxyacetone kinase